MKQSLLILSLFLCSSAMANIKAISGKWIIVDFISAPVSAWTPEDARRKLERGMIVYPDWYVTHSKNVKDPSYSKRAISDDELYDEWRMTLDDFMVKSGKVLEYEVRNKDGLLLSGYGSSFLVLSERRLAVPWDGLFVIYEKS